MKEPQTKSLKDVLALVKCGEFSEVKQNPNTDYFQEAVKILEARVGRKIELPEDDQRETYRTNQVE